MNWTRFKTHFYHNRDLGISLDIYPRWLVEIDSETFTDVVG